MAYVASLLFSRCVQEDQNVLQRRSLMKETEGSSFGLVAKKNQGCFDACKKMKQKML
jgi:hypothetical protein